MYIGYQKVAGTEVVNVARTMAYIKAGYGAADVDYEPPCTYDGLAEALGEVYRTPALDEAPWYDVARPETYGFAGVLPLGVTGLLGTTATAAVVENINEGGVVQKARRASRTIAEQALLVGNTSEAVDAGLLWLTSVLERACASEVSSAQLEGFSVLPGTLTGLEDLEAALADTAVDPDDPGWRGIGGNWHPDTETFQVEALPSEPVAILDGGLPWTVDGGLADGGSPDGSGGAGPDEDGGTPGDDGEGTFDGGGPDASTFDGTADGGPVVTGDDPDAIADGGELVSPPPLSSYARLIVPTDLTCLSKVVVTWTLTPLDENPASVQVGAVDPHGLELRREAVQVLTGETTIVWEWEHAAWDEWRPAVWSAAPGIEVQVSVARRPFLDPEVCLAPLRRSYAGLRLVAGPTPVATFVGDNCDTKVMQVEWTWTAGTPHRYGDPYDLLVGLDVTDDTAATAAAAGVSYANESVVAAAGLVCDVPLVDLGCGYDPLYPGFVTPPAAPVIADPGATNPANYHRRLITLDSTVVPDAGTLALRWSFQNNSATPIRGVRVRLWRELAPTDIVECEFESEFWINYIDNDATLVVDGIASQVVAVCDDDSLAPARGVMRGPYRGTFAFPTAGCAGSYFIAVDTPSTMADLVLTLEAASQEY